MVAGFALVPPSAKWQEFPPNSISLSTELFPPWKVASAGQSLLAFRLYVKAETNRHFH